MPAQRGAIRGFGEEQLPQSLSAAAPSTSFSSELASRGSSLAFRRRSGGNSISDTRPPQGDHRNRSLGGTTYVKDGKRYRIKEGPQIEDLLMPGRRTCFPYWPSYVTLILFLAFWGGFAAIGIIAFRDGKPARLTHPTDMFGFSCGEENSWNGITVDLTDRGLLYWLDPFELTNPRNRWFAKGICVSACPSPDEVCRIKDVPCTAGQQYRCPYYALAQDSLYNTLPYDEVWGTEYFDALRNTSQQECWATKQGIPPVFNAEVPAFLSPNSTGAQRCGEFYQLTSQYPGTGPCYANWAYSTIYLSRCVPVFPPEIEASLTAYKQSHPNDTRTNDPLVQPLSGWDVGYYLLDVINGWELILFSGFVAPVVLAVVVMLLMMKRPATVIWLGIVCCVLAILADTLLSFVKAGKLGSMAVGGNFSQDVPEGANPSVRARKLWIAIGSLLAFATLALFILAMLLGRHVKLVANLIRAASRIVMERPLVLLMPVLPLLAYGGLALFWVWSTIYLFTASSIEPVHRSSLNGITTWWSPNSTLPIRAYELLNLTAHAASPAARAGVPLGAQQYADATMACAYDPDCYLALSFSSTLQHLFTYNYFGFWLANEFITTVTGVCIVFYLSHHFFILADDTRPRSIGFWNAVACTWLALPPLMVGTFANAVVDWFVILRPICSMLDKSISRKPRDPQESRCRSIFCAPIRGIGYVASKLMKYSDRHGYFCGALYNKTYWQGCRIARKLADSSEDRLGGAFESAGSVFLLCKGAVAGLSILMALLWSMTSRYGDALNFPSTYLSNALLPIFFCILSAYFVAELWAQVYEASLAVLLLGFCEDCRVHGGKPHLSPKRLIEALQEAARQQASRSGKDPGLQQVSGLMHSSLRDNLQALPHEQMTFEPQVESVAASHRTGRGSLGTGV